jgi:hypothetical protein
VNAGLTFPHPGLFAALLARLEHDRRACLKISGDHPY